MKIRTLIADDESLARDRLRQLLAAEREIEVIGECADGQQAAQAIQEQSPDLIFLDVNMPELDGFAVLEVVDVEPPPVIVFVTAYDRFAVRAFEVYAADYLLKPFDRERFHTALQRATERIKHRQSGELKDRQSAVLAELKRPRTTAERLPVKSSGRVSFVKITEIDWVQAAHNYVELHVNRESHLLRETLNAFEARLAPEKFIRISRSTIVNRERIKQLQSRFYGGYTVVLQDGTRLSLSRRYRGKLRDLGVR